MEVRNRQQVRLPRLHPIARLRPLALRAMPIPTAVVSNLREAAFSVLATRDMAAEDRRPAIRDRTHHFQLAELDMATMGVTPRGAVIAEDIRDLQSWAGQVRLLRWLVFLLWRQKGRQPIERAHDAANDVRRNVRVAGRRIQIRVSEQNLDHANIDVLLQ